MKTMRKGNDEIYQLAKDWALVKMLKNERVRPFCLCPPDVMFVARRFKDKKRDFLDPMNITTGGHKHYQIMLYTSP